MNTSFFFPDIPVILFLLVLNALFVATEQAYLKLRFSHFNQDLVEQLKTKVLLSRILENPVMTIGVLRMVITGCIVAYVWLISPLLLFFFDGLNLYLANVIAFFIALMIQAFLGEFVPRGLGLQYPLQTLRVGAIPTTLASILLLPVMRPLNFLTGGLLRAFGADEHATVDSLDVEEQIDIMESEGGEELGAHSVAQKILKNALTLRELDVSDVLLPRNQVQYFDLFDSVSENLKMARMTGHTRFPLCEGDLDNCIGLVHIKDLFRSGLHSKGLDLRKFNREILRFKEDMPVEDALEQLMQQKKHMGLVVDEFGGTQGVLSLERILEVIVGEIQDEFDVEEANIKEIGNGDYAIMGLTPLHEVEECFDMEFETDEVSTFGGLITSELGEIPQKGQQLTVDDLNIRVTEVDEKRVIKALARPLEESESPEKEDVSD
jgi:CBS domain containing-hemolysin-like protein